MAVAIGLEQVPRDLDWRRRQAKKEGGREG